MEHLYPDEAISLLREIYRILKKGSIARIAVPSMEYALQIASEKASHKWPREFNDGPSQAINYLFCDGQHKYGYTFEILKAFVEEARFNKIINYSDPHGNVPKQYGRISVGNERVGSIIIEATK